MLDEKTQQFLDNIIRGKSNEELFKSQPVVETLPERDLASEAIISFAPALFGALGGESAAISQVKGGQQARELVNAQRKEQQANIDLRNKASQDRYDKLAKIDQQTADNLLKREKIDLDKKQFQESQDLKKELSKQATEDRRLTAGMMGQYRGDARELARQDRLDKEEQKREDKELQLVVPNFERTSEVLPTVQEAQKLREAASDAEELTKKLERVRDIVKQQGSFELGGELGTEMKSLATEIQLLAKSKSMYDLGVLTGPDLGLLQSITADPESLDSLFTRDKTRIKQIETQLKSVKDKLGSATKARGYKPVEKQNEPPTREQMIKELKARGLG
jgi:hypothetical protein